MKKGFVFLLVVALFTVSGCCQKKPTMKDASIAYKKGDYKKAAEIFAPEAEKGNSEALINMAFMYYCGLHVKKDHKKAAQLYKKAAQKGNPNAQFALGTMYENGEGIRKNLAKAYFWYILAEKSGDKDSRKLRREAERRLSYRAVKKVKLLIKKWKPEK